MKKRILTILFAGILACGALFAFSGCTNKNALKVVNFRVEDREFYSWFVEEFEKETGIDVVYEAVGTDGYSNLLNSRLLANDVDVFGASHTYVGSEEMQPKMLDLSDLKYPDGTNLWQHVTDSSINEIKIGDLRQVAPLNEVVMLVYYNKQIVKDLGISYANGEYPTTWTEFELTMSKALAKKNKGEIDGVFCYGGMESWPISMYVSAAEGNTVRAIDPDFYLKMAKSEEGYDFGHPLYLDFFNKLKSICEFIDPLSTGVSYSRAPANFAVKKYAMMVDGSWSYATVKAANPNLDIGFFPLPANDEAQYNRKTTGKGGAGFCINAKSTKIEQAKKFVEFHYREDIYQRYIDFVCSYPSIKGFELTDVKAREMFSFENILTAENMWIPGLQGTDYFRTIASDFISGKTNVQAAVGKMNKSYYETDREKWQEPKRLNAWLKRWYPGESRG